MALRGKQKLYFFGGDVLFHKLGEHFWENFSYALFMTYIYKYM